MTKPTKPAWKEGEPTHVAKVARLRWQYALVPIAVEPGQDPEEAAQGIDDNEIPDNEWEDGDIEGPMEVDEVEPYEELP